MMEYDNILNGDGGYVFISHSHNDIEKVRQIRNILEEQGFEPLCFFLRCLTDESELDKLIKREIDARELFVLADSENARASTWVKEEIDHIYRTGRSIDRVIHLDDDASLDEEMQRLMNSMRVFISYARRDADIAGIVKDELIKRDLKVFLDLDDLLPGEIWADQIPKAIETSSQRGCFVLMVSQNSVKSGFVLGELSYAALHNALIIPVIIGDVELPQQMMLHIARYPSMRISDSPTQQEMERLVGLVESALIRRYKNSEE